MRHLALTVFVGQLAQRLPSHPVRRPFWIRRPGGIQCTVVDGYALERPDVGTEVPRVASSRSVAAGERDQAAARQGVARWRTRRGVPTVVDRGTVDDHR
jgi:hypothetical protein